MSVAAGLLEREELPFRGLIGPELGGHRFIDDRDLRSFLLVSLREDTSSLERDLQSFEVAGSDGIEHDRGRLLAGVRRIAVGNYESVSGHNAHRHGERLAGGDYSWQRGDALIELPKELLALRRIQAGLLHVNGEK